MNTTTDKHKKLRQWGWFVGLWTVGLLTVSALGYMIKFVMGLI